MKHVIAHDLDVPTAKKVVERAFAEYQHRYAKYDPRFRWATDHRAEVVFSAMGATLEGKMDVGDHKITLDLHVPFFLRPFKGRAMEIIDREVSRWLVKAHAGEV